MFGLSFLSPLFLVGAAAAAVPIALHLFYRRTEPVINFAAMRFLRGARVEHSRHRRLKEVLLLALRIGALVLLALAFARPYLSQSVSALNAPATIVLVDRSASLSAPGQFEHARELAAEAVRRAPANHGVGVIAFGNGADVIAPISSDRAAALAAVSRLTVNAGAGAYAAALSRAAETLGDRPGHLVVITDLQQSGWDGPDQSGIPPAVSVELVDVGSPSANVAVTSLRTDSGQAVAIVRNFSSGVLTRQVVFKIDDREIGTAPVSLAGGGSGEARLSLSSRPPGTLTAAVDDPEGYAADNVRYLPLDAAAGPSILVVTTSGRGSEAFYLERALTVAEGPEGFRLRIMSGPMFSGLAPQSLSDINVVAVLSTRGLERRGREILAAYVRNGGGLLLTAGPDVDVSVLKDALRGVMKTSWRQRDATVLRFAPDDGRHPIFRVFGGVGTLGNVEFQRTSLVDASDNAGTVARYTDGSPALVEEQTAGGRVLVFASDLNRQWNDFPLQPAFVPFVHELVRYVASARTSRAGYLVGELPGPIGATPGVVRLNSAVGSAEGRRVAVNVDPRESDPARMTPDMFQAGVTRLHATAVQQSHLRARDEEDSQRFWQYGLLLMVMGLLAEGMLGRRLG